MVLPIPADLHQRLLDEYAGPSLVVNDAREVVHVSEGASRYLRVAPGEPSRDLFRMAREELRVPLRDALNEALRRRAEVDVSPVRLALDTGEETVSVRVRPVFGAGTGQTFFLVLLSPVTAAGETPEPIRLRQPRGDRADAAAMELSNLKAEVDELRLAHSGFQNLINSIIRLGREADLALHPAREVERHAPAPLQVVELLRQVVRAQEDERARIARDLHDELGQQLTALRLVLHRHRDTCGSPDGGMQEALDVVHRIDTNVNFLARELRPPELDNLGLAAALGRHVREWSERTGVHADVNVTRAGGALPADVEVMFYRIAQEALNNAARHAQATQVDVILENHGESTVMIVEDNGQGFDPSQQTGSLGLLGMRERASLVGATLDIESTAGKGTTIFLRYPDGHSGPSRT